VHAWLFCFFARKRQNPGSLLRETGVLDVQHKEPDDYLLSHGQSALSSAWSRFTVLFGMGRGGTDSLWSSGMTGCCVAGGSGELRATANLEEA
jgi:hypothetical protein